MGGSDGCRNDTLLIVDGYSIYIYVYIYIRNGVSDYGITEYGIEYG